MQAPVRTPWRQSTQNHRSALARAPDPPLMPRWSDPRLRHTLWPGAYDHTRDPTPGATEGSPPRGGTPGLIGAWSQVDRLADTRGREGPAAEAELHQRANSLRRRDEGATCAAEGGRSRAQPPTALEWHERATPPRSLPQLPPAGRLDSNACPVGGPAVRVPTGKEPNALPSGSPWPCPSPRAAPPRPAHEARRGGRADRVSENRHALRRRARPLARRQCHAHCRAIGAGA